MAKDNAAEPVNFERELARLEEIVGKLEAGALGLDESIALYEEGVKRLRGCQDRLAQAEAKIKLLVEGASGQAETRAFDASAAEEPASAPKARTAPESTGPDEASGDDGDSEDEKPRRRPRAPRGRGLF